MAIPVMVAIRGEAGGLLSALGTAGGAMDAFGGSAENMAKKLGGIAGAATMALAGIGLSTVRMAADFETAMTQVYTASNMTKAEFASVSDGVKELSTQVGYSANELASGMLKVYSAGFRGEEALNVLRVAAQGARVGVGDLTDTAKALGTMMFALDIPASQAVQTMDKLMTAVRIGNVELGELSTAMSNVIPAARVAGIGLDEVAAAMAVMTASGMPAYNAGTSLRFTLLQLSRITPKAAKAMENFGLSASDVSNRLSERGLAGTLDLLATAIDTKLGSNLRGLDGQLQQMASGSLEEFQASIDSLPESQKNAVGAIADMLGGIKSLQGALMLMGPGADEFKNAIQQVGDASKNSGADVSKFGETAETFNMKWENFKNQMKNLAMTIGEILMPHLERLVEWLQKAADWMERNSTVVTILAGILMGALGLALIMVIGLFLILVAVMLPIIAAVALVVGAIVLLILGIRWLIQNFDELVGALGRAYGAIMGFFAGIFSGIINTLMFLPNLIISNFNTILGFFTGFFSMLGGLFNGGFGSMLGTVSGFVSGMLSSVTGGMSGMLGSVSGAFGAILGISNLNWSGVLSAVSSAMSGALGAVSSGGAGIISSISGSFSGALGAARGFIGAFTGVGSAIVQGITSGVLAMAGSLASAAASVVRNALNAARSAIGISSPSYDFKMYVGVEISAGIIEGIKKLGPDIDKAVSDVVRGPLNGDYSFGGSFQGNGNFRAQGAVQGQQGGIQVNVAVDFSGNFYGTGGARQAALDIQRELLRIQQSGDLGIVGTISGSITP